MHRMRRKTNIKRAAAAVAILAVLFSALALSAPAASAAEGGGCGTGLSWSLNAGTLTISGSGNMTDYTDYSPAPWDSARDDIVRVVIGDGVGSIGDFAFYHCTALTAVDLPDSIRSVGGYAFTGCTSLRSVSFGGGVTSIGEAAFYGCSSLTALRLPYGLSTLGSRAFYRCSSLCSVVVPENVTEMGDQVFAYCGSLVRAEVRARLTELPAWTFYGCDRLTAVSLPESVTTVETYAFKQCESLSTVYYKGSDRSAEIIGDQIAEDLPTFGDFGYISNNDMSEVSYSGRYVENDDSSTTTYNTTVKQNDRLILIHTVARTTPADASQNATYTAEVNVTVDSDDDWEYAVEQTKRALAEINDTYSASAKEQSTTVNVYMQNDTTVSDELLNELAGRSVTLHVTTSDGAAWRVDCSTLSRSDGAATDASRDYSHTVTEASEETKNKLGTDNCYKLVFASSPQQEAELTVQLPPSKAVSTNAFLYREEEDGSYTRLQGTAVDNSGVAHFYVASASSSESYVIGLNVPGESTDDVIIPDELASQYGAAAGSALARLEHVTYVRLERTSSWGMGAGQVTWILIAVLVGTTVIVGGIMFAIYKMKRLRVKVK